VVEPPLPARPAILEVVGVKATGGFSAVGDGVLVGHPVEQQKLTFRLVDALRCQVRVGEGRYPDPSAGLMDSQSVKGADTVGADSRGYDAGKKINGRKRFIVTDTLGLLLVVLVLPASVQDRDGARKLLLELRRRQLMFRARRRVRHLFADSGFAGVLVDWATIATMTRRISRSQPATRPDHANSPPPKDLKHVLSLLFNQVALVRGPG